MRIVIDLSRVQNGHAQRHVVTDLCLAFANNLALAATGCDEIQHDMRVVLDGTRQQAASKIVAALKANFASAAISYCFSPSIPSTWDGDPDIAVQLAAQLARLHFATLEPDVIVVPVPLTLEKNDLANPPLVLPGAITVACLLEANGPDYHKGKYEFHQLRHCDLVACPSQAMADRAARQLGPGAIRLIATAQNDDGNSSKNSYEKAVLALVEAEIESRHGTAQPLRRVCEVTIETTLRSCAHLLANGAGSTLEAPLVDALIASGRPGSELGCPRLLIDVTMTNQKDYGTGIQRVVKAITHRLQLLPTVAAGGREVIPVTLDDNGVLRQALRFLPNAQRFARSGKPVNLRTGDTLLMLDSSWAHYQGFRPLFARLRTLGGTVASVVYDMVPISHREVTHPSIPPVFEAWFTSMLMDSDGLICISRAVADEVIAYIGETALPFRDGLRIGWWHLGSDIAEPRLASMSSVQPLSHSDRANRDLQMFLGGPDPVFLMVSTIEPRKRHALVLKAMEQLWAQGSTARLLLLGRAGWHVEELVTRLRNHPEVGQRLLWCEKVSDAAITFAYRHSTALVYASLAEGFGLPIVEAARQGLTVIASDIPVHREIGGNGALYFPVDDCDSLVCMLRDILAGRVSPSGTISTLSWEESAHQLMSVLYADQWYKALRNEPAGEPV